MAIPVDYFVEHRDELLVNGRRTTRPLRAWVGLYCYELRDHVVVAGVLPGAPGEQAGLRAGDVIVGVNGTKVRERREFYRCLWTHKPGDMLRLDVFRENALTEVQLQAGDAEQFFA
jgi:S1-C subfamily serine protease